MKAGTRLLIVDCDPMVVATRIAFKLLGYETVVARTPDQAIELTRQYQPHAILLDWGPRSGLETGTSRRLREVAPPNVVIIGLSTLDEPDGFCEAEALDDYFVKPIEIARLDRRLRELGDGFNL